MPLGKGACLSVRVFLGKLGRAMLWKGDQPRRKIQDYIGRVWVPDDAAYMLPNLG